MSNTIMEHGCFSIKKIWTNMFKHTRNKEENMEKKTLPEYLGDITPELLLQNLTNTNQHAQETINTIRALNPERLMVSAEYEFEWEGDSKTTLPKSKRFVGFSIVPES